jgi:hypothetical protein
VQLVFAGRCDYDNHMSAAGERRGVYVRRVEGRKRGWRQQWAFRLVGRVAVEFWGDTGPRSELADLFPREPMGAQEREHAYQEVLLKEVEREGGDTRSAGAPRPWWPVRGRYSGPLPGRRLRRYTQATAVLPIRSTSGLVAGSPKVLE